MQMNIKNIRSFGIKNRWTVHSYYSLDPYAPDGSGRILCAGCDLDSMRGEVFILDKNGDVTDRFGNQRVSAIFFHTGFWQAWGKDGKYVYYQCCDGDVLHPKVNVRELATGKEYTFDADMEGAPIYGEPLFYGLSGMYYASGYANGRYCPELSPVPFEERDRHGLFRLSPKNGKNELVLSAADILALHPDRERLEYEDARIRERLGNGATLMIYCVRYTRDGKRLMFHFGNHCTDARRNEPHLLSLFTADCEGGEISNVRCVLDMNFEKNGVHWSWADSERLIGYTDILTPGRLALSSVKYDSSELKTLSLHPLVGGHSSICPAAPHIAVTDGEVNGVGNVIFIDTRSGEEIHKLELPKINSEGRPIPSGRNRHFVCHHPVFSPDGKRLLTNILPDRNSRLCEIELDI